jgi:hypothetical protein
LGYIPAVLMHHKMGMRNFFLDKKFNARYTIYEIWKLINRGL